MLDGRAGWGDFSVGSSAVLADGMSISIQLWFPNCDLFFGSNRCGQLVIDTNGSKRPNKMGRDMFEMFILDNRVLPNGATGSSQDFATHAENCNPIITTGTYNGAACAGRIIPEGGMKY